MGSSNRIKFEFNSVMWAIKLESFISVRIQSSVARVHEFRRFSEAATSLSGALASRVPGAGWSHLMTWPTPNQSSPL